VSMDNLQILNGFRENPLRDDTPYQIFTPVPYPRRHWIGYLFESYNGVVTGMWVVPTLPLDGNLPPYSRVYVYNIYKWNFGLIGATIRVEEDRVNNRWIALQQEYTCPTSGSSPVTPPPAESGLEDGVA